MTNKDLRIKYLVENAKSPSYNTRDYLNRSNIMLDDNYGYWLESFFNNVGDIRIKYKKNTGYNFARWTSNSQYFISKIYLTQYYMLWLEDYIIESNKKVKEYTICIY